MTHCSQPMLDMGTWPQHDSAHRPIPGAVMQAWKCSACGELVKVPRDEAATRALELVARSA